MTSSGAGSHSTLHAVTFTINSCSRDHGRHSELYSLLMACLCLPLCIPSVEILTDIGALHHHPLFCTNRAFHPYKDICHAWHLLHTAVDQPDLLILGSN